MSHKLSTAVRLLPRRAARHVADRLGPAPRPRGRAASLRCWGQLLRGCAEGGSSEPVYKPKSPQALYILAVRGSIKMAQGLKTLKEAETIAKGRWAVLPKVQKEPWEKMKKA